VTRYVFTVEDLHLLRLARRPAHYQPPRRLAVALSLCVGLSRPPFLCLYKQKTSKPARSGTTYGAIREVNINGAWYYRSQLPVGYQGFSNSSQAASKT